MMSIYRQYLFSNFFSKEETEELYEIIIEDIFFQALKEYVTNQSKNNDLDF